MNEKSNDEKDQPILNPAAIESVNPVGTAIDFKKYRTPQLAAKVAKIVDVSGKFYSSFKIILVVFLAFIAIVGALFWGRLDPAMFTITAGYTVFAGAIFAIAMAIARVVKSSLSEMEQLVELLFTVTKQIAADLSAVGSGSTTLPSARKLVEGVYGDVLLPVVEQVASTSFGWFGWPVLAAYRMTLGRLVRVAIKLVPDSALTNEDQNIEENASNSLEGLQKIADNGSQIAATLTWTQQQLGHLGGKAKFIVLLPCYLIGTVMVSLLLMPLVAIYFLN